MLGSYGNISSRERCYLLQTSTTSGQMDKFSSALLQQYIPSTHEPAEIEFCSFLFSISHRLERGWSDMQTNDGRQGKKDRRTNTPYCDATHINPIAWRRRLVCQAASSNLTRSELTTTPMVPLRPSGLLCVCVNPTPQIEKINPQVLLDSQYLHGITSKQHNLVA